MISIRCYYLVSRVQHKNLFYIVTILSEWKAFGTLPFPAIIPLLVLIVAIFSEWKKLGNAGLEKNFLKI